MNLNLSVWGRRQSNLKGLELKNGQEQLGIFGEGVWGAAPA